MSEKLAGVYLCSGCGIGDALDMGPLAEVATSEYKVQICRTSPFWCTNDGVKIIEQDIKNEGVNYIVVAGCSARVNYDVFNFGPSVMVERVNLREGVAWTQAPLEEDTQAMGEDYLRMYLAKIKSLEFPVPFIAKDLSKKIMIVGGGLTGMNSALEAAKAGYQVVIVEKESSLGGWLKKNFKIIPLGVPYTEAESNYLAPRIREIESHLNIQVYTSAIIERTAGGPGLFDVTINHAGKKVSEHIGAIILATGSVPYNPVNLKHLGYGISPNVITQAQFEEMAALGNFTRPSDGKIIKKAAFIQCAGSRDREHLAYCSAACCVESVKQAIYIKDEIPGATVCIFYKDIRSSGQHEHFYKQAQIKGVMFIKADVTGVTGTEGSLCVRVDDLLLGMSAVAEDLDLVILANGMVSTAALDNQVFLSLDYRQGSEIPSLKYGFPDSHFICFPYETRRTGIYAAGSVRRPMDMAQALEDAAGAALKAVQCIEMTARGESLHPRSGDLSVPDLQISRCTQCKRCTEECSFGAINEDEKANPLLNLTRCRRCGTCMGACPERVISFKNYSLPLIGNMLKAIKVPEEEEEKPRILIFACENDVLPALDMAGINRLGYSRWVRVIPVRCLGSLNLVWVNDAMSMGIDGVLLMGCKHGDDYQCHFMKGSELAGVRLANVSETLGRMGLESERVDLVEVSIMDYSKVPTIIEEFSQRIEKLGPNPMKGL